MGSLGLITVAAVLAGWVLTGLARRLALAHAVMDIPNERSSHSVPTPRGGGLGIAAASLAGALAMAAKGVLDGPVVVGIVGGGILVAWVGWLDDRRGLPVWWRVLGHVGAASWLVFWLGGLPAVRAGATVVTLGWLGSIGAVVGVVWSVNLYNFMDGIDGLAGIQGVIAGLSGGILLQAAGAPGPACLAVVVGGACAGFLIWNWSPARIFMGDIGSGLLGFLFGALALVSERTGGPAALSWGLLLGVFLADATITLIRRILRGERWYAAHRAHAYQRAVQSGLSHATVSLGAGLLAVGLAGLVGLGEAYPAWRAQLSAIGLGVLVLVYGWVEHRLPFPGR